MYYRPQGGSFLVLAPSHLFSEGATGGARFSARRPCRVRKGR